MAKSTAAPEGGVEDLDSGVAETVETLGSDETTDVEPARKERAANRSPQEIAQANVDKYRRQVERLEKKRDEATQTLETSAADIDAAQKQLAYAEQNPALAG